MSEFATENRTRIPLRSAAGLQDDQRVLARLDAMTDDALGSIRDRGDAVLEEADDVDELQYQLEKFTGRIEKADLDDDPISEPSGDLDFLDDVDLDVDQMRQPCYSLFVKEVHITCRSKILEAGMILSDLPGITDLN